MRHRSVETWKPQVVLGLEVLEARRRCEARKPPPLCLLMLELLTAWASIGTIVSFSHFPVVWVVCRAELVLCIDCAILFVYCLLLEQLVLLP
jgi:hypothetical protein